MSASSSGEKQRRNGSDPVEIKLPGFRSPLDPSRALRVGGRGLPREHVTQVQQERIIDAFVQVVAENGYEGAGIKAICRRAGVAFNTFYEFFATKEQLFLSTFDTGVEILLESAGTAFRSGDAPWEIRVETSIRVFLQILADNPSFARFAVVEVHKVGPDAMFRVNRQFEAAYTMFSDVEPAPGLSMTTPELLPLVIGGIYARIYSYIHTGRTEHLPELLPNFMEFVQAMLGQPTI